jgi:hypothetical protein
MTLAGFAFSAQAKSIALLEPEAMLEMIETAHHAETYASQEAIQADFELSGFGGLEVSGTMWFTPSMGKVRMEIGDDILLIYDGETAWQSPADAEVPGPPARFHVLTWPYFVAAPYKLNDPGTQHESVWVHSAKENPRGGLRVTFDAGVGDTPDDWYIAMPDEQGRLGALAYIVTYGKDQETAEKQPSVILYSDFEEVQDVPFATTWTFHYWNQDEGVQGEPKGQGSLSNIKFVIPPVDAFVKPEDAVEAKAPGS